jgi:superfamily II DNA or RNA helicase
MMTILKALPPNTPTLILANKKSLVEQNYDEMKKWGFPNVGRLYDKYKEPSMFTCATVQSLHKIAKILPHIRALVVDEIHDMMSKVPKKFYNKLTNCSVRVAVSATPFKYGGQDKTQKYAVKGYFGPIMRTDSAGETGLLTTKGLQGRDILSGSKSIFYVVDQPKLLYEVYLDAVTKGIAENIHFHKIVTGLARTLKGRTLILVERLSHGDTLHSMIPGSLWVQGKDDLETRKYVISQLSKSNDNVIGIATQGIFNAGINVFIHNLINAAGGQADHQIVQRMGRGLRVAGDKDVLNYYDFLFKINEYLEGHSNKRIKILRKEGHDVEIREQLDFPI